MPSEVELKAILTDPTAVRLRLFAVGAAVRYRGPMSDRRYDRGGELTARDEVLRLRTFGSEAGSEAVLGWKGPARRSEAGYKEREEIELAVSGGGGTPDALLAALGYAVVHSIDRWVEVFDLAGTMLRLESYPGMDDLLEVEGEPDAIERAIAVTGLPRSAFSADSLGEFVQRYESRTGRTAVLAASGGRVRAPAWADR